MFEGCPGGQPSLDYRVVVGCPGVMEGSHKQRNQLNRLKARKKAGSHLGSVRRPLTARVI